MLTHLMDSSDRVMPRFGPHGVLEGSREMLLYEALARARMREAEEEARRYRLARRLAIVRRWARVARYAAARAERARVAD